MSSRKRSSRARASSFRPASRFYADYYVRPVRSQKILHLNVPVPERLSRRIASESYTYVHPRQRQKSTRSVRLSFKPRKERYRVTRIKIVVPASLPRVRGSVVSVDREGRLVIAGARRTAKTLEREFNRVRYKERKTRHRKARHGQLDSLRSDPLGIVGHAISQGHSIERLADAALVARAIAGRF